MDFAFEVVDDLSEIEDSDERSFSLTNEVEDNFADDDLLSCSFCGSCVDPDTCVFGIVCPKCDSAERQLCREERGSSRLVGLHEERWRAAKGKELAWR